jgi:hypothetical protein
MMVNPGLQLSVAHLNLKQPLSIILLLESLINHKTDLYITISCDRTLLLYYNFLWLPNTNITAVFWNKLFSGTHINEETLRNSLMFSYF